ncbi:MAG TPA: DUF1653 domain-containing protein [Sulfurovum sp.]|nr:DUF1653 domain-containing protein [Sulfurovum sp.]
MTLELGKYRHYKGKEYEVLMLATHSETEEEMVVYRMMYGEESVWVRPYDMFIEMVDRNGSVKPRFEKVPDGK